MKRLTVRSFARDALATGCTAWIAAAIACGSGGGDGSSEPPAGGEDASPGSSSARDSGAGTGTTDSGVHASADGGADSGAPSGGVDSGSIATGRVDSGPATGGADSGATTRPDGGGADSGATAHADSGATSADSGSASTPDSGGATASDGGAVTGPCDLYRAGGTPCVAAFSTVRALLGAYDGNLYQVTRADGTTMNIGVLSTGGIANAAAQDTFCAGSTCTISILYDQSGKNNHLTRAPKGTNNMTGAQDNLAVASALPITIGGHKAYGVHSPPHTGYRNNATQGVATGDAPEVIYEVSDGTYDPQGCCFDFGNAETTNAAGGPGEMEALLLGKAFWDTGAGNGPWVLCDMEVGVYNHGGATGTGRQSNYPNEPSMAFPFVTAMVKGNSANATTGGPFTVKGSNAQSGALATWYDGARPQGYSPMRKHGAIILGIGGDDSNTGGGNFYEGVMTAGYSTDATDDAVQANVVAAGYGK